MPWETTKANKRRKKSDLFREKVFVGRGIDVGCGEDILDRRYFKKITSIEPFDINDGDAQYINKYKKENSYDFIYSSNCLEHMNDPVISLQNWFSLVKEGGYLAFTVPDEDLYEQGSFPSRFNADHKWTFTIFKEQSWSPKSVNIVDLLKNLENYIVVKIELVDTNYDYSVPSGIDQTMGDVEAFIEVILRKTRSSGI